MVFLFSLQVTVSPPALAQQGQRAPQGLQGAALEANRDKWKRNGVPEDSTQRFESTSGPQDGVRECHCGPRRWV